MYTRYKYNASKYSLLIDLSTRVRHGLPQAREVLNLIRAFLLYHNERSELLVHLHRYEMVVCIGLGVRKETTGMFLPGTFRMYHGSAR